MKLLKNNKVKETWRDAVDLEEAKFSAFHDYFRNDKKTNRENDGCLGKMIKRIVYIVEHKEKFNAIKKTYSLEDLKSK